MSHGASGHQEEKKIVGGDGDMAPGELLTYFITFVKTLQHVPLVILEVIAKYCAPFIHPTTTCFQFVGGGATIKSEAWRLMHNNDFLTNCCGIHWQPFASPPHAIIQKGAKACASGDFIYFVGGIDSRSHAIASSTCIRYDSVLDAWLPMASMASSRLRHSLTAFNNRLYAYGGSILNRLVPTCEIYSIETDSWAVATITASDNVKKEGMLLRNQHSHQAVVVAVAAGVDVDA
jgi:hypothetical protein